MQSDPKSKPTTFFLSQLHQMTCLKNSFTKGVPANRKRFAALDYVMLKVVFLSAAILTRQ